MRFFLGYNERQAMLSEENESPRWRMKIEENRIYGNNKGQTGSVCTEMTSSVADELSYTGNSINKSQYHLFLKRVFYWLQGPGDRLYNSKSSSENKDLERKKKMLFHLVPE